MSLPPYTNTYHKTPYPSISPLLPALSAAGRTILITGGGSGIGPAIVHAFAAAGSTQLAILGRTDSSLQSTKLAIEFKYPQAKVLTFVADIVDEAAVNTAFEETVKQFGAIDIFVSNAGYMPDSAPIVSAPVDEYMLGLDINVKGPLLLTQAFLRSLSTAPSSSPVIINITTAGAHLPAFAPGISAYAVSKLAGLKMFEYVALENPSLRVMNVHPGVPQTEMNKKSVAAGLVLPNDDIELSANFVVWAASEEGAFLRNKVIWANWDVGELKAKREELEGGNQLTVGLLGWP